MEEVVFYMYDEFYMIHMKVVAYHLSDKIYMIHMKMKESDEIYMK